VFGREIADRKGLRRPRHQLLHESLLAEGGPEGEVVIVRMMVVAVLITFPWPEGICFEPQASVS
jgi:hypothetical protein